MTTPTENVANAVSNHQGTHRRNAVPSPEQLKVYADQLPAIYRDLLAAFQYSGLARTEGDPVAFATLRMTLLNEGKKYTEHELEIAAGNLSEAGLLEETEFMRWFAPTPTGEALIATITGTRANPATVPALPAPPW